MSADAVVVGEMTLRGLARRRLSLGLLVLLPLSFYVARHEHVGQSVRFLAIGLAWAVSTVAFFAALDVRRAELRLRLGGWSWRDLVGGRVAALLALGLVLAAGYLVVVVVDRPIDDDPGVAIGLVATTVVAALLGSFLGAVVGRELEGALLLFIVCGLQFIADPPTLLARVLPFWSTRELATYAIDGPDAGSLAAGLAHAGAVTALLGGATLWSSWRRLRTAR